ncbi:hypothetical protein [Anaerolentibacter hominis]|uniref:hypothetical protein n=1 Tax=Anaerolentibacter hominis TaxID=3079009 RepID=UPI0031B86EB5
MKKLKRILALTGVILLCGLYVATLISAIFSTPATAGLFKACLFSTFFIPVFLYAILLIYRLTHKKDDEQGES